MRLPVIVPKTSAAALRVNYVNEQCRKTHEVEIVGWLTTTIVVDAGLDADHEKWVVVDRQAHSHGIYGWADSASS